MTDTATENSEPGRPLGLPLNDQLGHVAEARWYCLSRDGVATRCVDEEDAKEVAAESWVLYPNNGPYRVAQMVDRQQPLTRQQIDDVMTEHYPLDSLLRENVDAFEACVRDIERLHGIGA